MKREKIYCLLGGLIISILLCWLTLEFTEIRSIDLIIILLAYFCITASVLISAFAFLRERSKVKKFALLVVIDAWMSILSFIFATTGTMKPPIKTSAYAIFVITFLIFPFFCERWSKYENNGKENTEGK